MRKEGRATLSPPKIRKYRVASADLVSSVTTLGGSPPSDRRRWLGARKENIKHMVKRSISLAGSADTPSGVELTAEILQEL